MTRTCDLQQYKLKTSTTAPCIQLFIKGIFVIFIYLLLQVLISEQIINDLIHLILDFCNSK